LAESIVVGLSRCTFEVVHSTISESCHDAACYQRAAGLSSASHVVLPTLERQGDDYVLALELIDGQTGASLAIADDTCDLCGLAEAAAMLEGLASSVGARLDSAQHPPILLVTSTPSGALVSVDDEPLGTTPMELPVEAGEHRLTITKSGFIAQRRQMHFVDGIRETLTIELDRPPPTHDGTELPRGQTKAIRSVGFTSLGVGLASLGAGIALMAINQTPVRSRCSGSDVDIEGNCRLQHETLPGGVAMTALGGVGVVVGIVFLSLGRSSKRARLTAGGFAWRF